MLFNKTYMYMHIINIHAYTLNDLTGNNNEKKLTLIFTKTQLSKLT